VRETLRFWRRAPLLNALYGAHCVLVYCFVGSWASIFVRFERAALRADPAGAAALVGDFALVAGLLGAVAQPLANC
jgi:hypothetical protein